ncbi:hypothetical protein N8553_00835 [bacterium]|nr:hypothetical protein [bacterium]
MAGLKTFFAGLCLGSVTSLVAMQIHVVNTNDGLTVLPRSHRPPISTTYVDVREWSISMWRQHPEVAEAALKSGRLDLLGDGALNSIFPKQAGTNAETVPASKLATDKAKLAMEALVPIKFTTPDGKEKVVTPSVPNPVPFSEIFPKGLIDRSKEQQEITSNKNSVVLQNEDIFPQNYQLDEALLKGLPKLQRPIPIRDDVLPSQQIPETAVIKPEQSDLFTDVLKALIPPKAKEQASILAPQHSVAHPAYRIEAPSPNSEQVLPQHQPLRNNNPQPSITVVRPF